MHRRTRHILRSKLLYIFSHIEAARGESGGQGFISLHPHLKETTYPSAMAMPQEAPVVINLLSSDDEETVHVTCSGHAQPRGCSRPPLVPALIDTDDDIQVVWQSATSPRVKRRRIVIDDSEPPSSNDGDNEDDDICVVASTNANSPPKSLAPSTPLPMDPSSAPANADVACVGENRGVRALVDYPHMRFQCITKVFVQSARGNQNAEFCPKCFCYVCDAPASECKKWRSHANAHDKSASWRNARQAALNAAERALNLANSRSPSASASEPQLVSITSNELSGVNTVAPSHRYQNHGYFALLAHAQARRAALQSCFHQSEERQRQQQMFQPPIAERRRHRQQWQQQRRQQRQQQLQEARQRLARLRDPQVQREERELRAQRLERRRQEAQARLSDGAALQNRHDHTFSSSQRRQLRNEARVLLELEEEERREAEEERQKQQRASQTQNSNVDTNANKAPELETNNQLRSSGLRRSRFIVMDSDTTATDATATATDVSTPEPQTQSAREPVQQPPSRYRRRRGRKKNVDKNLDDQASEQRIPLGLRLKRSAFADLSTDEVASEPPSPSDSQASAPTQRRRLTRLVASSPERDESDEGSASLHPLEELGQLELERNRFRTDSLSEALEGSSGQSSNPGNITKPRRITRSMARNAR